MDMSLLLDTDRILAIDIGGTSLKAGVLSASGALLSDALRCPTPDFATPETVCEALEALTAPLGKFHYGSVGFPGAIRYNKTLTAPNLAADKWTGIAFADMLGARLGVPIRLANDATVQGLGAIAGRGIEVILTLGTGMGFALFRGGIPAPQIELGRHPLRDCPSYDDYIGDAILRDIGESAWKARVHAVIAQVRALVNQDHLYLGGGNARLFSAAELPADLSLAPYTSGLIGGRKLWLPEIAALFEES
jgi:polyphosphate glucokinase